MFYDTGPRRDGQKVLKDWHQDPVEDGGHPLAEEDGDRDEVSGEANRSDDHLQNCKRITIVKMCKKILFYKYDRGTY